MAKSASKKIMIKNKKVLTNLLITLLTTNILSIIIGIIFQKSMINIKTYLIKSIPELIVSFYIYKLSRPKYIYKDDKKTVGFPGYDLENRGIIGICFDGVYLSIFIKFISYISNWFYFLYFGILMSVFYEFKMIYRQ